MAPPSAVVQRLDLRVRPAELPMTALSDQATALDDHTSDLRIGRHPSGPPPREPQRLAHVAIALCLIHGGLLYRIDKQNAPLFSIRPAAAKLFVLPPPGRPAGRQTQITAHFPIFPIAWLPWFADNTTGQTSDAQDGPDLLPKK